MKSLDNYSLPWAPLFTIERSGKAEVTRSGIISVVDGKGKELLTIGDVDFELWSRSCLKPWQLLSHLPILKQAYPDLEPHHWALGLSSHSGESFHVENVRQMLALGGLSEDLLQCPPGYPMLPEAHYALKAAGEPQRSIYHNCSGKHAGYLLAMSARKQDLKTYLQKDGEQFVGLKHLLAWLVDKRSSEFDATIDGCRLPNYPLSAKQMAFLYCRLTHDSAKEKTSDLPSDLKPVLQPMLDEWHQVKQFMHKHSDLVGGTGRLDTRIMKSEFHEDKNLLVLAKQGADGLLAIGVSPSKQFPDGLGILIKIASGSLERHHEMLVTKVFEDLGLQRPNEKIDPYNAHIQNHFHFKVSSSVLSK